MSDLAPVPEDRRVGPRVEIVEIATGSVLHVIPVNESGKGTAQRYIIPGVLNNIGRFDARFCRPLDPDDDREDMRLDTDRFFAHLAGFPEDLGAPE